MWCAASPRHLHALVVGGMKSAALLSIGIPSVALAEPLHTGPTELMADLAAVTLEGRRVSIGRPPAGTAAGQGRRRGAGSPGMISGNSS
jgi:hypothetical protein